MRRLLLRWMAPLVLAFAAGTGLAFAQTGGGDVKVEHGVHDSTPDMPSSTPPALAYAIGILLVLGVLVLICMPSRKPESYNTR